MGYAPYRESRPSAAAPLLGFLTVVGVTGVALFATNAGYVERTQPARPTSAIVYDPAVGLQPASAGLEIDVTETTSVTTDETTPADGLQMCNVVACADTYRSFTASDCTYQPFDGPRRLCTR